MGDKAIKVLRWVFFSSLIGTIMILFFPDDVPFRRKILNQMRKHRHSEDFHKDLEELREQVSQISEQLEDKSERLSEHVRAKCESFLRTVQHRLHDLEEKAEAPEWKN